MRYTEAVRAIGGFQALMAVLIALCLALTLVMVNTSAASAACQVKNATRGGTYKSLAAAVKAARNWNTLVVRGTCIGSTKITNKKLTIIGKRTRELGWPLLRGNGRSAVLKVSGESAIVTLKSLALKPKPNRVLRRSGGGITINSGKLVLKDVKVKGFETKENGGGIYNFLGTLFLSGTTKVVGNRASGSGGGIHNASGKVVLRGTVLVAANEAGESGGGIASGGSFSSLVLKNDVSVRGNSASFDGGGIGGGPVTLNGRASISNNSASVNGGGIAGGPVTLNDRSSIRANTAEVGGGVYSRRDLIMNDDSVVTGNTATLYAGGVDHDYGTRTGVVCHPDANANVYGNSAPTYPDCWFD